MEMRPNSEPHYFQMIDIFSWPITAISAFKDSIRANFLQIPYILRGKFFSSSLTYLLSSSCCSSSFLHFLKRVDRFIAVHTVHTVNFETEIKITGCPLFLLYARFFRSNQHIDQLASACQDMHECNAMKNSKFSLRNFFEEIIRALRGPFLDSFSIRYSLVCFFYVQIRLFFFFFPSKKINELHFPFSRVRIFSKNLSLAKFIIGLFLRMLAPV